MVSESLDSVALHEITDVEITYADYGNDLVVAVHPFGLLSAPLPGDIQPYGRIFLKQVSVGAVVKALDDLFFSAGMHHSEAKFGDVLGNACLYRLNGAAGMPLGAWLPSNFYP